MSHERDGDSGAADGGALLKMTPRRWILGGALPCLWLCACGRGPALPGSPEYAAQFGVVPEQAVEMQVNGVTFRFPEDQPIDVETSDDKIVKGRADKVYFSLDLTAALENGGVPLPGRSPHFPGHNEVQVEIGRDGTENPATDSTPRALPGFTPRQIGERWGLRQFTDTGGEYYSSAPGVTPKGGPVYLACHVHPHQCAGGFEYPQGLFVRYYIDATLLPHWRLVFDSVLNTLKTYTVQRSSDRG